MNQSITRNFLIAVALLLMLPAGHASLNDNVDVFIPFDYTDGYSTADTAGGRTVSCYAPGMSAPQMSADAGYASLENTYCLVPALDMGDNFTVCTRFRQVLYDEAILSTYGSGFSRSGGAFELYVNYPWWDQSFESMELGVILDSTPDDAPGSVAIEQRSVGLNYTAGEWHTVCSSYDGGVRGEAFRLYFDGVEVETANFTFDEYGPYPGGYNRSRDLVIGAGNPDGERVCPQCFQDAVVVYKNRVLNAQEVADLTQRLVNGENYPFQESVSALDGAIAQEYDLYVQTLETAQSSSETTGALLADAGITPGQMKQRLEAAVVEESATETIQVFAMMATPLERALLEESVAPASSIIVDVAVEDEYLHFQQTMEEVKQSLESSDGRSVSAILAEAGITPGQIKKRLEDRVARS